MNDYRQHIHAIGLTPGNDTPDGHTWEPCVATIGFFDGVHLGHRFLIEQVERKARQSGLKTLLITFDRHPRQVLQQQYQPQLLTTLDEKLRLLCQTGIDDIAVLHFDTAMASLTARDFMQQVLHDRLSVRQLVIGYDNRFGHNRAEGFDDYVAYGRELGIDVVRALPLDIDGLKVSSSLIREFLYGGEVEMAERCLGRPFTLRGRVERGVQEGRRMGFPTANLAVADGLLIPQDGVYAVEAQVEGHHAKWLPGMMNIGNRPTFHGHRRTLETYLFDFSGDLYGRAMAVRLLKRIRSEQRFDSEAALARQLKKDEADIRQLLANTKHTQQ